MSVVGPGHACGLRRSYCQATTSLPFRRRWVNRAARLNACGTVTANRQVRIGLGTKLDDGHELTDERTLPGTCQGAAPRVTGDVSEPELLDRRKLLTSRMQRDDVIDGDGTARARRCFPVDRLTAELAAVVGPRP